MHLAGFVVEPVIGARRTVDAKEPESALLRRAGHPPRLSQRGKLLLAILVAQLGRVATGSRGSLSRGALLVRLETAPRWHRELVLPWPFGLSGAALSRDMVGLAGGRVCDTRRRTEHASALSNKRHRFPPGIVAHAVWLSCHFALSYHDVGELLAERGVVLTLETVRRWCRTFGQVYANALRRRAQPGDRWHPNVGFMAINGVRHSLWRAVDQDGNVLDSLVQSRRDKGAATKFLHKLRKGRTYVPRVVITDKRAGYGVAKREA